MTQDPVETTRPMGPDERLFRERVQGGAFALGEADGRWRLISVDWPQALVWVAAANRDGAPDGYILCINLDRYPSQAPTAQFWSIEADAPLPLDQWPRGAPGSRVDRAFNPGWRRDAIYMPCDRVALQGHGRWPTQYRRYLWTSKKDITFYLNIIHDLLHSTHYQGVRSA